MAASRLYAVCALWAVLILLGPLRFDAFSAPPALLRKPRSSSHLKFSSATSAGGGEEIVDVVVIGSGIGGLSCAALLAASGRSVRVLEQHYEIGGCAHEYNVDMQGRTVPSSGLEQQEVFRFEAGPSLYSGLSPANSPNPLKHIYQMIGEEPEWIEYDLWGAYLPEAPDGYELSIGADNFIKILKDYGDPMAVGDWEKLSESLRPMAKGIMGIPSTAVRSDAGVLLTLGAKYPLSFLKVLRDAKQITAPFDLEALGVKSPFLKNYLDLIAFLLQGLPANQTLTAVMAYMVEDFYREVRKSYSLLGKWYQSWRLSIVCTFRH